MTNNLSPLAEAFKKHIPILSREFIPTGLQEDIILEVGRGKNRIIIVLDANRVGKTTVLINIAKNIIWPADEKYFAFWPGESVFKNWPYKTKRFRITGTPTNLADNGIIQQSIDQWWPRGRFEKTKGNKHFYSVITTDSGWEGDCLTYEQSREEFEGQTLSLILSDEPPKPTLIGAFNSRMAEGGIWLCTMTPIECGAFLDSIDDLQDSGSSVKIISGTIFENDIETGKLNHLGTKRGLWTKQQIDDYVNATPKDEREARLYGKASHKSGKIFDTFDRDVHIMPYEFGFLKQGQAYMCIDPHIAYFPFCQWWVVLPNNQRVCYNEWPTYEDMGCYYDEIRTTKRFEMTIQQLSDIIKVCDLRDLGFKVEQRYIDPFFASGLGGYDWKNKVESIQKEFAKCGLTFKMPDKTKMPMQIDVIRNLLKYEKTISINEFNMPLMVFLPHCKNSIRAMERHYWEEGKEKEAETYKDSCDCTRMFTSSVTGWRSVVKTISTEKVVPMGQELIDNMREISLGGK